MAVFESGYLALYRSDELKRRAEALEARLASCDICPLFQTMAVLGKEHTLARIDDAIKRLAGM